MTIKFETNGARRNIADMKFFEAKYPSVMAMN
jgi:hypothetical protein